MPKLTFAPNLDKAFEAGKKARAKERKRIQKDSNKSRRQMFHGK